MGNYSTLTDWAIDVSAEINRLKGSSEKIKPIYFAQYIENIREDTPSIEEVTETPKLIPYMQELATAIRKKCSCADCANGRKIRPNDFPEHIKLITICEHEWINVYGITDNSKIEAFREYFNQNSERVCYLNGRYCALCNEYEVLETWSHQNDSDGVCKICGAQGGYDSDGNDPICEHTYTELIKWITPDYKEDSIPASAVQYFDIDLHDPFICRIKYRGCSKCGAPEPNSSYTLDYHWISCNNNIDNDGNYIGYCEQCGQYTKSPVHSGYETETMNYYRAQDIGYPVDSVFRTHGDTWCRATIKYCPYCGQYEVLDVVEHQLNYDNTCRNYNDCHYINGSYE